MGLEGPKIISVKEKAEPRVVSGNGRAYQKLGWKARARVKWHTTFGSKYGRKRIVRKTGVATQRFARGAGIVIKKTSGIAKKVGGEVQRRAKESGKQPQRRARRGFERREPEGIGMFDVGVGSFDLSSKPSRRGKRIKFW